MSEETNPRHDCLAYYDDLTVDEIMEIDEQRAKFKAALEKIADPRILGHTEPDYQTRYYCLIHLATESLAGTDRKGEE